MNERDALRQGNFYEAFARQVEHQPDAACLQVDGAPWLTRAALDALARRYAAAFRPAGCTVGDRVAVQLDKSEHSLAVYLACLRAGLVFVPVNTAYQAPEVEHLVRDSRPRLIVCRPEDEGSLGSIATAAGAGLRTLDHSGSGSLARAFPGPGGDVVPLDAEQPAALLYTSGTTGRPKGALISHRAMWHSAQAISSCWLFSERDVLLHALPLFHGHGLFVSSNVALFSGARIILLPKFTAPRVVGLLPACSVFMGVPTFYHRLLLEPGFDAQACRNVRLLTSGSAPLAARTHAEIRARTGHAIVERYGATEAMVLCSNPVQGDRRQGSVGVPLPGVELRVVNDRDEPVPVGGTGAIQARGPGLFSGYWGSPEQTRSEFTADGFFRTGDLGWMSADGYLTITGRQKDLVITGGYNVYPAEVEAALCELPGVAEAAVVGVPHPDFGEAVVAFIVPEQAAEVGGTEQIVGALRSRLANYKLPKRVHVVPEFPRNAMGKILKNSLRTMAVSSHPAA